MTKPKLEVEKTNRGFDIINFEDGYNVKCSLQKSSIVEPDCIWFGCDDADPKYFIPNGNPSWRSVPMPAEYIANTRMHLSRDMVKALLPFLKSFAKTGELSNE